MPENESSGPLNAVVRLPDGILTDTIRFEIRCNECWQVIPYSASLEALFWTIAHECPKPVPAKVTSPIQKLIALHNALVSVRANMAHPSMDGAAQWYKCVKKILDVADNETMAALRRIIDQENNA